jgi:hypothetical protein
MSIAIMQPYVFPYIGYFQLVHAADIFVFYDDVNFINRGWINRNRILINGKDQLFSIPCNDASQNRLIMDIELQNDPKVYQKLLATLKMAYGKAPFFNEVYPLIEGILFAKNNKITYHEEPSSVFPFLETEIPEAEKGKTIAQLAIDSVISICDYVGLQKQYKVSSEEYNNRELKKADRLIDICHLEGQKHYINPSGGREIYTKEYYKSKGVDLDFLIPEKVVYPQFKNEFVPWLSVIDVLMFNSPEDIKNKILPSYHLE